jgi:hypothetical protein
MGGKNGAGLVYRSNESASGGRNIEWCSEKQAHHPLDIAISALNAEALQ